MTISRSNPTWLEIEAWAKAQIEAARDQLEQPGSEGMTQQARGRIAGLRALLNLPDGEKKPSIPEPVNY